MQEGRLEALSSVLSLLHISEDYCKTLDLSSDEQIATPYQVSLCSIIPECLVEIPS